MTRFLYIADTHLGAGHMGCQQQKAYPEELPQILSALRMYMSTCGEIDFILHGGDMIDSTTEENILAAAQIFDFPVPIYLCLGNHDLTTPDALEQWLELAPQFFVDKNQDYTVTAEHCVIHVAPNQWSDHHFYWDKGDNEHLSDAQTEYLSRQMLKNSDVPHMLLTHSPVYGLPTEQTGLPDLIHAPVASFTAEMEALVREHPTLKCVLGAHSHKNMRVQHDGVQFVTVSSLVESPFEIKLFEVTSEQIHMTTVPLRSGLSFDHAYDATRSIAQGRDIDRSFTLELN